MYGSYLLIHEKPRDPYAYKREIEAIHLLLNTVYLRMCLFKCTQWISALLKQKKKTEFEILLIYTTERKPTGYFRDVTNGYFH